MVHNEEEYNKAVEASEILFGNATTDTLRKIDEETFLQVLREFPNTKSPYRCSAKVV